MNNSDYVSSRFQFLENVSITYQTFLKTLQERYQQFKQEFFFKEFKDFQDFSLQLHEPRNNVVLINNCILLIK